MQRVKDLYEAILKPAKNEDKCTNLLIWLLSKLPESLLQSICRAAELSFCPSNTTDYRVQVPLPDSRPDAIIEADGQYLIIETKISPDNFNEYQFSNHLKGAVQVYGSGNVWLLLISGDASAPPSLRELRTQYHDRIGFISWRSLLMILGDSRARVSERDRTLINEFLLFAAHLKLGRIIAMTNEELAKFVDLNAFVLTHWGNATNRLLSFLNQLSQRIIAASSERVEVNEDEMQNKLPSLYTCLKIKGWHTSCSAYVFLNIVLKQLGIVLVGYEGDPKEKRDFTAVWESGFKSRFKDDGRLHSFSWIYEEEDEFAIDGGYFKEVDGTSGLSFNPQALSDLRDCFYWGYLYDFDPVSLDSYFQTVPSDFVHLLDSFPVPEFGLGGPKRHLKNRPNKPMPS